MRIRRFPPVAVLALAMSMPALAQQPAASLSSPGAPAAPANTIDPTVPPGDSPAAAEAHQGYASSVPGGFAPGSTSDPEPALAASQPDPTVSQLLTRGSPVKDDHGAVVGKVARLVTDSRRRALSVVVRVGRREVTLPVADLSAEGGYLVDRKAGSRLRDG